MEIVPQIPLHHRLADMIRRLLHRTRGATEALWPVDDRPSAEDARRRAAAFLDDRRDVLREQLRQRGDTSA